MVVGSVLSYEVAYDSYGKPKWRLRRTRRSSGLVSTGFTFELGDLAVPTGASVTADPGALAAATRIVVKTTGLRGIGHGALTLSVVPVHDEAPIATLGADRFVVAGQDPCDVARDQVGERGAPAERPSASARRGPPH